MSEQAAGQPGSITIMLAEDHGVVRAGLRMLLSGQAGFRVVAEAGDVASTERRVASHQPDVLVLDLSMPDGSSLPAIPRIRQAAPGTRIVILTMRDDAESVRQALRSGATGYVLKESAEAELIEAVRQAAAGRTYLTPQLGARLAAEPTGRGANPDDLTEREVEVLRLIALGHTNAEVAEQLFLSVRTIESHRARIQQKTGRGTRAQLVAYAHEHRLV